MVQKEKNSSPHKTKNTDVFISLFIKPYMFVVCTQYTIHTFYIAYVLGFNKPTMQDVIFTLPKFIYLFKISED